MKVFILILTLGLSSLALGQNSSQGASQKPSGKKLIQGTVPQGAGGHGAGGEGAVLSPYEKDEPVKPIDPEALKVFNQILSDHPNAKTFVCFQTRTNIPMLENSWREVLEIGYRSDFSLLPPAEICDIPEIAKAYARVVDFTYKNTPKDVVYLDLVTSKTGRIKINLEKKERPGKTPGGKPTMDSSWFENGVIHFAPRPVINEEDSEYNVRGDFGFFKHELAHSLLAIYQKDLDKQKDDRLDEALAFFLEAGDNGNPVEGRVLDIPTYALSRFEREPAKYCTANSLWSLPTPNSQKFTDALTSNVRYLGEVLWNISEIVYGKTKEDLPERQLMQGMPQLTENVVKTIQNGKFTSVRTFFFEYDRVNNTQIASKVLREFFFQDENGHYFDGSSERTKLYNADTCIKPEFQNQYLTPTYPYGEYLSGPSY